MEFINKRGYLDAQFDSGTAFILAKVSGPKGKRKIGILKNRLRFERGPPPIYGHRLIVDVQPKPPGDDSDGSDSDTETDSNPDGIGSGSGGVGPSSDGNESGSEVGEGTTGPGAGSTDSKSEGTGTPPGVEEETNPDGMGSNSDGNESGSEVDGGAANPGPGGAGGTGTPPGGNNSSPGVDEEVNPGGAGSNSGEGSVSPGSGSDTAGTDPNEDNSGPSEGRRNTSNAHGNFSIKSDSTFSSSSGTNNSTCTNEYNHFNGIESNRNCGQKFSLGTLVWNSPDHGYEGVQPHCRPYHVRGYPPKDLYLDGHGNIIFNKPRPSPPKIDSEGRIPIPDY
ncbi:hypothetical protein TWF970_001524 [Orbilia oligospora]|uniref:Uncharacterized protein n=1 Tax=Orbilia oligospora TaxID=2813651 RepID=A0A7C8RDS6_ORBOL|nr:hypothetical protein TWF970_001524 [Orbilia oligospora]